MTRVSIVIACFNGAETLGETLNSLVTQEWDEPWEIVFADNGSTDESRAIFEAVRQVNPSVRMRLVDASAERGKAFALNLAIPQAEGDGILLADADDVASPGWLRAMGTALGEHDLVGAVTDFNLLNEPWVLETRLSGPNGNGRQTTYRLPKFPEMHYLSGHCMGFRKAVYDAIGGFSADYIVAEDVDFSFRAQLAGYRIKIVPDAVINYRFRAEVDKLERQAYNYAFDQIRLATDYPEYVRSVRWRWSGFIRGWKRLNDLRRQRARATGKALRVAEGRYAWHRGWQRGLVAGMIRFRSPVP